VHVDDEGEFFLVTSDEVLEGLGLRLRESLWTRIKLVTRVLDILLFRTGI
jgi:hypothetical protein